MEVIIINTVEITIKAQKQLLKLPQFIQSKLRLWVFDVENNGLSEVQKTSGYHDEPLQGSRKGQRSIRLNRAYRAIYEINNDGRIKFVKIVEVNKHDY